MTKSLCAVSIDVDTVSSHLRGYGVSDCLDRDSVYVAAFPRMLKLFEELHMNVTFFLVAEDVERHRDILQSAVSAGHELASHSLTHPTPLALCTEKDSTRELSDSKDAIERYTGAQVIGFRAPGWDLSPKLLTQLQKHGYHYDASLFPSWALSLLRKKVQSLSEQTSPEFARLESAWRKNHSVFQALGEPTPFYEIPLGTTCVGEFPCYHTLHWLLPRPVFSLVLSLMLMRQESVSYVFHAADFLGLHEDGIDVRLKRHPGMSLSLSSKLQRNRRVLERIQ